MPPPPIPVDPALENNPSWDRNAFPNAFEQVLPPVVGPFPPLQERPAYPYQIGNNGEISPHDIHPPYMRRIDHGISPLDRFTEEAGPWSAQGAAIGETWPTSSVLAVPNFFPRVGRFAMPSQMQVRSYDRSEVGSSTTGRNPHDSGYDSKSYTTMSVQSLPEQNDRSQDCQSLVSDVGDLQMHPGDQFQGQDVESLQDESHRYGMNDGSTLRGQLVCPHPDCENITFKNQSDQK